MKMNCVAVIVWFVCGECTKAINILKSINKLALLFQWMYSTSINLWKQHSLKQCFCFMTWNVLSSTRVYSCNGILYIILSSIAFQSYVWVWRVLASFFFLFKYCTFHLYRFVSCFLYRTLSLCFFWHWYWYILIICSFMNQNADCLFKEKNKCCASKCLYVRSYISTTVFWML